jgi:hypothetical protein
MHDLVLVAVLEPVTRGTLRVQVNDHRLAPDLRRHLIEQGFPTTRAAGNELSVLFPGGHGIFAAAAELDLWCSGHAGVSVLVRPEAPR